MPNSGTSSHLICTSDEAGVGKMVEDIGLAEHLHLQRQAGTAVT